MRRRTNSTIVESKIRSNSTGFDPLLRQKVTVFIVPVATNITLSFIGQDANGTTLKIRQKADPGLPAVGCYWDNHTCTGQNASCNSVSRNFSFAAKLYYVGSSTIICFQAVNDQLQCPRYVPNLGSQDYGVFVGAGINGSQESEPFCVKITVPPPNVSWVHPTPAEDAVLEATAGCDFKVGLAAMDDQSEAGVEIQPWPVSAHRPHHIL